MASSSGIRLVASRVEPHVPVLPSRAPKPQRPRWFGGDGAVLMWGAMASAALSPLALVLPFRDMMIELFVLAIIVSGSGVVRLVIASAYRETRCARAYAIWALTTSLGAALLVSAPLIGLATPVTAFSFVLALEAATVLNIARVREQGAEWLRYGAVCSVLAFVTFMLQKLSHLWIVEIALALNLAACAYALMHAGLKFERRIQF